jgi:soluble lytic murein transglycosylase-like protein
MSIKILSPIDEVYLSKLNSAKNSAENSDSVETSFSDALVSAKEMLDSQELSDAEKNAVRAVTVDAAVDAIQENGGYGLSLDSSLAKSLGLSEAAVTSTPQTTDTSSVQVETAEEAAARNATSDAAQAAAASQSSDDTEVSDGTYTGGSSKASSASGDIETYSVDEGELTCSDTLNDYFEEASETYDVDMKLLKCIALVESSFNPDDTSSSGAMGVMQLMPDTASELGVEDPYDAYQNIMGGAKYISQLLDKYDGDIALAAAAYNAGPGAVSKYDGIPPFEETQNYVTKVLSYYNS